MLKGYIKRSYLRTKYYSRLWCAKRYPPIHTLLIATLCSYVQMTDSHVSLRTPPTRDEPWWTYFGSNVSHWGNAHFFSNIISIIIFGAFIEIIHGNFAAFSIFWFSCISGSTWHVALERESTLYRGASPGVYGLIGAYLAHIIINWREAPLRLLWLILVVFEAINVTLLYNSSEYYRERVAHWSHAFGFIQGMLISLIVLRNMVVHKWEIVLQIIAFFSSASLIVLNTAIIYSK